MRKIIFLIIAVTCLYSCKEQKSRPKLNLDKFIYTAYSMGMVDGFQLKFRYFISIDTNGVCHIMRCDDTYKYFTDTMSESLIAELNELFVGKESKTYLTKKDTSMLYDGLDYFIEYNSPKIGMQFLSFIPKGTTAEINHLQKELEHVIDNAHFISTPIDLIPYSRFLKNYYLKENPPPPRTVKFTPPVEIPKKPHKSKIPN